MLVRTDGTRVPDRVKQGGGSGINNINGLYVGSVVKNKDSLYSGRIEVQIPEFGSTSAPRIVLLVSPFGGTTEALEGSFDPTKYGTEEGGENGTPKSYGMWPHPPAVGTEVLIAFTTSREEGFLMGSFISKDRNHMLGGRASSESQPDGKLAPVGEKNPYDKTDPDKKPIDGKQLQTLTTQGLTEDFSRGHSNSSARRESPSRVFGITTRGGHVISMDDGDIEGKSTNMRFRTRGGAQILIDDTNEFMFITNHKGNAWVELDSDGRIDVYSETSVSIHSEEDFNIHAKGNVNIESDMGVNIRSTGTEGVKVEATTGDYNLYTGANMNVQAALNGNVTVAGNYMEQAARIDMNGPVPTIPSRIITNQLVENKNVLSSAASRVPEHHPWKGVNKQEEKFRNSEGNT